MKSPLNELIKKHFPDKNAMILELAVRDANIFGTGFVAVDKHGNFTLLDAEEAAEKANEINSNR